VKLVHRTTRRLTLTSHGEAWLENCIAALTELERGENILKVAQNTPAGQVRIDLPTALGRLFVMPVLLELASRCPAILLKVSFSDGQADLISEGIELAVRIGKLDDTADLISRPLGAQQMVICATPNYLAARGTPQGPADLAEHDWIVGWHTPSRQDEALRNCLLGWFKMTSKAERYLTVCLAAKCPSPCYGRARERYPQRSA
jgi:DNA-binding transcriptional LysR family regulator